ncbi:pyridoxal phosphate-dependent aminotransferase [Spongiivirga citrea]|uniref:Aminotransferase n=1 Tax=Spongiivirga citrea TaxID=1481457 RepID=A0A6M0CYJ5_9FLAO|nr:aminotransferase class I/II-fold pyridoxal phosphate-dependent enzyme [Spongiivirga citrea]NER18800.1 aminotransferase class I/II-fold pyridoxal phosphate-dependent enzyme [Spongiivirga citrea]
MISTANRLLTVEEYYFSQKLREVNQLIADGKPVINMGIGSPDLVPPALVLKEIAESLLDMGAHKYQSYQGLPSLRNAFANFYKNKYKVAINPNNEVLPLMGSKEGIMHISMAYLDEGDQVLIPNPGYPTYSSVSKLVGAQPVYYDLNDSTNWLPDLDHLSKTDLSKVKIMWINYPHMPTGTKAPKALFKDLLAFARTHRILIVNDNPYSFVLNENPTSILAVEGAKDVALELNSLSKTFNMAGWRVGMVLGNEKHIKNILKVKSNMDSGMFYGIQKGAIAALNIGDDWYNKMNAIYHKRREMICQIADKLGCKYQKDTAGMFVWCKLPDSSSDSKSYINELLESKNIFVAPGSIFGSNGEGYIRFSLCVNEEKIEEALSRF